MMRPSLSPAGPRLSAVAAPRYTSYPTAPQFHRGVGEDRYRDWLAATSIDRPISLYLHVPFCREMCWYCACNMKLAKRYEPLAAYVGALLAEIDLVERASPGRLSVSHLHWGGGTPTALKPADLERVMTRLHDAFDIGPEAEIAIEADPRSLAAAMIERLGALGFTRASFGVQEFDPDVQKAIHRIQPPEQVAACVRDLRNAGVRAINFDLVYGLPRQTTTTLRRTVERCLEMRPDRVALFGYAHVPWMAKRQRLIDETALPGPEERLAQAEAAAALFKSAGYQAIGLDHFALPSDPLAQAAGRGALRRNFQGYTTDQAETLIGLGATSISRTPSGYAQNVAEPGAYARMIDQGRLPVAKGVALKAEDKLRGAVIERLMCDGEADLAAAAEALGADLDWWKVEAPKLEKLALDGLIAIDGARIRVTRRGAPYLRVIASTFDAYLSAGGARHSKAV